jgi:hypothetical protein
MRAAGLLEAPDERFVRGLHENQIRLGMAFRQMVVNGRELAEGFASTDVGHDGGPPNVATPLTKLGEPRDEIDGQIVNAIETEILEGLEG